MSPANIFWLSSSVALSLVSLLLQILLRLVSRLLLVLLLLLLVTSSTYVLIAVSTSIRSLFSFLSALSLALSPIALWLLLLLGGLWVELLVVHFHIIWQVQYSDKICFDLVNYCLIS